MVLLWNLFYIIVENHPIHRTEAIFRLGPHGICRLHGHSSGNQWPQVIKDKSHFSDPLILSSQQYLLVTLPIFSTHPPPHSSGHSISVFFAGSPSSTPPLIVKVPPRVTSVGAQRMVNSINTDGWTARRQIPTSEAPTDWSPDANHKWNGENESGAYIPYALPFPMLLNLVSSWGTSVDFDYFSFEVAQDKNCWIINSPLQL